MSETALDRREKHLERREAAYRARLAREQHEDKIDRLQNEKKGIIRRAAEEPFVDSLAEFGGTIGEATLKSQVPSAHPFVAAGALAVELLALLGYRKNPNRTEYRTVASVARGAQSRARVDVADQVVASIFA